MVVLLLFAGTILIDSPAVSANNCAFPVDVLRESSETFEAKVTTAVFREKDGVVVYSIEGGSEVSEDLVVVASPDDGVSGASFRVGQRYWFLPDAIEGGEARVEACKFGPTSDSTFIPPIFERSKDLPLELPVDSTDPFAGIELLFTGTIESATLTSGLTVDYTVSDPFSHHGEVPQDLQISIDTSEGVFLIGERAWFAPAEVTNGLAALPAGRFGDAQTISIMEEAFGLMGSDPISTPNSTIAELELAPLSPASESESTSSAGGVLQALPFLATIAAAAVATVVYARSRLGVRS